MKSRTDRLVTSLLKIAHRAHVLRAQMGRGAGLGVRILLMQEDQVILVKHTYQNYWFLPGGGIKHREAPMQAAVREAKEEAGVIMQRDPELLGIYSNFVHHTNDHCLVFASRAFTLGQASDRWEIEECRAFPIDALPTNLWPGSQRRIEEFLAGKRGLAEMW